MAHLMPAGGWRAATRFVDPVLLSYSQVLFTRGRLVGALLLAASLGRPHIGLFGLGAVLLSFAVVLLTRFSTELAAGGMYGYNPLLVGLACGALFEPSPATVVLAAAAVVTVVYVQTALESALGYFFNLPVLSLPFVLVTWIVVAAAPLLPVDVAAAPLVPLTPAPPWLPGPAAGYLETLGAILFSPSFVAGLLVLAAVWAYSRIAVVLSILGFAVSSAVTAQAELTSDAGPLVVGVNGVLLAIALGGVWFVPRVSSFVFAAVAVIPTALATLAAFMLLLPQRLPALILPFNVGVLAALYAMRQRLRDGAPKAVDFAIGTPEANLTYYRTRVARFGARFTTRFALPCSGRWTVTQGCDGPHTHKGLWRHALDFEVQDAEGRRHTGRGITVKDFYCYRLPVLAPADGTVVRVQDDVPDNPVGQRHPTDNWGNAVVLQHGIGLYSVLAHLAPGSVEVTEGHFVRQGTRLGLCGNSGRSFVPHLHLQLQASARLGAPTLALELHDVVVEREGEHRLHGVVVPVEGDVLRNLVRTDDVAALFTFPVGTAWRFAVTGEDGGLHEERVRSQIDLSGDLFLENDRGERLYFENGGKQFLVYDYHGRADGLLYLLYAALPRVPFEHPSELRWSDVLARRPFRRYPISWLVDLIDPFLRIQGERVELAAESKGDGFIVRGRGRLAGRDAQSEVHFGRDRGLTEAQLHIGGKTRTARLLEVIDVD